MEGKTPKNYVTPNYIFEHFLAKTYGWTLEYIRSLDMQDFIVHLRLCLASENMEREWDLRLEGIDPHKKKVSPNQVLNSKNYI